MTHCLRIKYRSCILLGSESTLYDQIVIFKQWEVRTFKLDLVLYLRELFLKGEKVVKVLVDLCFKWDQTEELITEIDKSLCTICAIHNSIRIVCLLASLLLEMLFLLSLIS